MLSISALNSLSVSISASKNTFSLHTSVRSFFSARAACMSSLEKRIAGVVDYVFGAISSVFFLGSMASIAGKCVELLSGPSDETRKKIWTSYGLSQVKTELVRDASSTISSVGYMLNTLRDTSWLKGRLWGSGALNCFATGFSVLSSGCEIVSQLRSISLINRLLEKPNSSMKVNSLIEHKKNSLFSIATSIVNIALAILFCASVIVGGPLLIGVSVVSLIVTIPLQFEAVKARLALAFKQEQHGACCKLFI